MKEILAFLFCFCSFAGWAQTTYINPATVAKPNGYSHAAVVNLGTCKMVILSGQIALDSTGKLIGDGDLQKQTEQVFRNIQNTVVAAGGTMGNVVKLNYFLLDASQVQKVRDVRDKFVNLDQPPASTLVQVSSLVRKEFLIEIEATAIISNKQ